MSTLGNDRSHRPCERRRACCRNEAIWHVGSAGRSARWSSARSLGMSSTFIERFSDGICPALPCFSTLFLPDCLLLGLRLWQIRYPDSQTAVQSQTSVVPQPIVSAHGPAEQLPEAQSHFQVNSLRHGNARFGRLTSRPRTASNGVPRPVRAASVAALAPVPAAGTHDLSSVRLPPAALQTRPRLNRR